MKRCPECRRDYTDETLNFCLDDGAVLLDGPASGESATAIFHATGDIAEAPTRAQLHTTDQTAALPGIVGAAEKARGFDKRLLVFPALIAIIAVVGFLGYRYITTATSERINSIAVLPFENRSGNADTDYLSDGLTDSLIFRFSQLPNLKVSPTSSVMRYKGAAADISQIAKDLEVDAVLSGRLTQVGDDLSISVQLIEARTKKLIWAEQYDRKMSDFMSTQREIATTLTQKMQLKLAGDEKGITKKYTNSNEAYQLYLKGRYHYAKRAKDDMFKAIDSYKKAIELDPNFALAYAATAEAYNSIGKNPSAAPKDSIPLAKAAATRALELDPLLPEAHSAFADSLTIYDWNWVEAESHFKRALELDPNISYIHAVYGTSFLTAVGRPEEAVAQLERAVELEPVSLIANTIASSSLIYARHYDKALAQAQKAVELDPDFPLAKHWLGMALILNGRNDEAIRACQQPARDPLGEWLCIVTVGQAYAKSGKRAEAEQEITKLRELGKTMYIRPYYIAAIYAALGEKNKAFEELERSFNEKDCYLGRASVDPFMDPLREDPRFKDLLRRMNLPQ